jgi:vacuolar iron transporter family protein
MSKKFPKYLIHDHHPHSIKERLSRSTKKSMVRDFVYGAIDGTVTTFAIVAGVKGADLSLATILILGASNVFADGFSMAAGNYLGIKAEQDQRDVVLEFERNQIKDHPEGEIAEIREIFRAKGFEGELLEKAVTLLTQDQELWLKTMMQEEHGMDAQEVSPLKSGLVTFFAFLLFGAIPLLPFIFKFENSFQGAVILTACAFFLLGSLKSFWSLEKFWVSGLKTLFIGSVAAAISYYVGDFLKQVVA